MPKLVMPCGSALDVCICSSTIFQAAAVQNENSAAPAVGLHGTHELNVCLLDSFARITAAGGDAAAVDRELCCHLPALNSTLL